MYALAKMGISSRLTSQYGYHYSYSSSCCCYRRLITTDLQSAALPVVGLLRLPLSCEVVSASLSSLPTSLSRFHRHVGGVAACGSGCRGWASSPPSSPSIDNPPVSEVPTCFCLQLDQLE